MRPTRKGRAIIAAGGARALLAVSRTHGATRSRLAAKIVPKPRGGEMGRYQRPLVLPTKAVGQITEARQATTILHSGQADLIALGRIMPFDPRWPWHAAQALDAQAAYPAQYQRSPPRSWACRSRATRRRHGPEAPGVLPWPGHKILMFVLYFPPFGPMTAVGSRNCSVGEKRWRTMSRARNSAPSAN